MREAGAVGSSCPPILNVLPLRHRDVQRAGHRLLERRDGAERDEDVGQDGRGHGEGGGGTERNANWETWMQ